MKTFIVFLFAALLSVSAHAQFAAGPRQQSLLSIPSGGYIIHSATGVSNIASPPMFRLQGTAPVLVYLDWGTTNATTGVSNYWLNFQLSQDGTKWLGPAAGVGTPALNYAFVGPGAGARALTNIIEDTETSGWNFIRLYSVSNFYSIGAASNTIYLTNATIIQGGL